MALVYLYLCNTGSAYPLSILLILSASLITVSKCILYYCCCFRPILWTHVFCRGWTFMHSCCHKAGMEIMKDWKSKFYYDFSWIIFHIPVGLSFFFLSTWRKRILGSHTVFFNYMYLSYNHISISVFMVNHFHSCRCTQAISIQTVHLYQPLDSPRVGNSLSRRK